MVKRKEISKEIANTGLIKMHNDLQAIRIETPGFARNKSFVYVLCGYFPGFKKPIKKIGVSQDYKKRYKTIHRQTYFPVFLDLVFYTQFADQVERGLHEKFKNERVKNDFCKSGSGEWFVGIDDESIVSEFAKIDYGLKKRKGKSYVYNFDYSYCYNPKEIPASVDIEKLIKSIELEDRSNVLSKSSTLIKGIFS